MNTVVITAKMYPKVETEKHSAQMILILHPCIDLISKLAFIKDSRGALRGRYSRSESRARGLYLSNQFIVPTISHRAVDSRCGPLKKINVWAPLPAN